MKVLRTRAGKEEFRAGKLLGKGGQGEVYRVEVGGRALAMKWYQPEAATRDQEQRIGKLIQRGAPSEAFLWPLDLVEDTGGGGGFGYLMALRPKGFVSLVELMTGRVDPSFQVIIRAAMNLANGFLELHAKGLCYGDISFGNIFFDAIGGEIRICDNDNVVVDGSKKISVVGTPRFMAPEIVRGESLPNSDTDRYSLAVLLFYLLMVHHPLEGQREQEIHCFDLPAMERLYGFEPLFIFDSKDDRNRPKAGSQDRVKLYWELYTEKIRELFVQSFTKGLRDPRSGRVRESEWRKALSELEDSVMDCSCGAELFYDLQALRAHGERPSCWHCRKTSEIPSRMKVGERVVILREGGALYEDHLLRYPKNLTRSKPWASIEQSKRGKWELKNCMKCSWRVHPHQGVSREIAPGASLLLEEGMRVDFGEVSGAIRLT